MKNNFMYRVEGGVLKMNDNNIDPIEAFTFVNEDDEQLEKDLKRAYPGRKGCKKPIFEMADCDSDSDSVGSSSDDQPDLGEDDWLYNEVLQADVIVLGDYFSEWNISRRDQIHLCRAYASYLAVQDKSINKKSKD